MRRTMLLYQPSRYSTCSLVASLSNHTYCRLNFFRCLSSSSSDENPVSNIVTRDSSVDASVSQTLDQAHRGPSGHINYRKHPGIMMDRGTHLPARLVKAMQVLFEKYPVASLLPKVDKLVSYLQQRQPAISDTDLAKKKAEIEKVLLEKESLEMEGLSQLEADAKLEKHKKNMIKQLRSHVYHWKPMQYDAFTSYIYLLGRTSFDYSVLYQAFSEISKRDANFKPTSIFHHGSKVGSGIWAANKIWQKIGEHYCVEESGHMNTIAQLLLQDGNEQKKVSSISGVHFRQFCPSPKEHKFSMVVSAHMLIEKSTQVERLQLVRDFWEMAENYLVIVENGTTAGFSLVNEAKDFILLNSHQGTQLLEPGHVFAPCPHDKPCPKLRVKNQPCLTESVLWDMDFSKDKPFEKKPKTARYSYVILKKGSRTSDTEWPRVLHPIKAQGHVHVHMCLPCGELQHVVIGRGKFEKHLYSCARHVDQGDRLPVSLSSQPLTTETNTEDPKPDNSCDDSDAESDLDTDTNLDREKTKQ
ncbi:hypothetical protein BsWGS_22328 [Bradybaena similaris]